MSFRTFDFPGDDIGHITVDGLGSGSITVEEGPIVEGSLNCVDEAYLDSVQIRQDHGQLRIELPHKILGGSPVQLLLRAPAGLSYNLSSGSADITARVAVGRSKINSGSGDITLDTATDPTLNSGSGDLSVGRLLGESAKLSTGSGDITVADTDGPITAKTGSGDVTIRSLRYADLKASSGSGDISVPSTTGSVDLRTASGSVTVGIADDLPAWLDLHTVSGEVRITLEASSQPAPGEPFVAVHARTASGEIAVYRA